MPANMANTQIIRCWKQGMAPKSITRLFYGTCVNPSAEQAQKTKNELSSNERAEYEAISWEKEKLYNTVNII